MTNIFSGRINRTVFFLATILHATVTVCLGWIIVDIYSHISPEIFQGSKLLYLLLLIILCFLGMLIQISLVSLFIRRLHDMNVSGWRSLFAVIPIANVFFGIYIFLFPGTKGDNDYGKDLSEFPFWSIVLGQTAIAQTGGIGTSHRRQVMALIVLIVYIIILLSFIQ